MTGKLTASENVELSRITESDEQAKELFPSVVPEDDVSSFYDRFDLVCRGYANVRAFHNAIKPIVGRALVVMRENPHVWKAKGFRIFEDVIQDLIGKSGISRSELFNCMSLAEKFPDLSPKDFSQIGIAKLTIAGKVLQDGADSKERDRLLDRAKTDSVKDFGNFVEQKYHLPASALHEVRIVIHTSKEVEILWRTWVDDPRVQAKYGNAKEGAILSSMVAECAADLLEAEENVMEGEVLHDDLSD